MEPTIHDKERRQQLINTITDALRDSQYGRMYSKEFKESIMNLVDELKALEEEMGVKELKWEEFSKQLSGK